MAFNLDPDLRISSEPCGVTLKDLQGIRAKIVPIKVEVDVRKRNCPSFFP
jgi:hypothetical protein